MSSSVGRGLPAGSAPGRVPGGASDDGPEDASFGGDEGEDVLVELGGVPDVHGDELLGRMTRVPSVAGVVVVMGALLTMEFVCWWYYPYSPYYPIIR